MKFSLTVLITFLTFLSFSQSKTDAKAAKEYFINKYPNGKKEAEGNYINGKEQGKWQYWHPNGQIKQESHYRAGRLHGMTTYYYPNGEKKTKVFLWLEKGMENIQVGILIKM